MMLLGLQTRLPMVVRADEDMIAWHVYGERGDLAKPHGMMYVNCRPQAIVAVIFGVSTSRYITAVPFAQYRLVVPEPAQQRSGAGRAKEKS